MNRSINNGQHVLFPVMLRQSCLHPSWQYLRWLHQGPVCPPCLTHPYLFSPNMSERSKQTQVTTFLFVLFVFYNHKNRCFLFLVFFPTPLALAASQMNWSTVLSAVWRCSRCLQSRRVCQIDNLSQALDVESTLRGECVPRIRLHPVTDGCGSGSQQDGWAPRRPGWRQEITAYLNQ